MIFQRKYNTLTSGGTNIRLPIVKRGVVDYAVGADWTPASGDVKVSLDGGAAANITNLPTAVAMGNTAYWEFILTATELTCKQIVVTVADSATKAVEDQAFVVETFGNASAMYPADISANNTDLADVKAAIGTPAGASIAADIASVQSDTNDIQTRLPASLVSGRIDASVGAMATDTLTAAALASDAVAEIQSGLSTLTAAGVRAAVGLATANLDTQIGTLATASALSTVAGYVDTEVAAIKAKTDNLPVSPAATSDIVSAAAIADAVWDEVLSGHLTSGTTGNALNAAGASGDPWSTSLPGAYGAGTAGKIVGDNINATISSRLAAAGYTAPLDAAGTRSAVGLASANLDTQLDSLPTNAELAAALGAADDAVLAQVALVKAKTDLIPASPAAVSDIPTANITAIKAKTDSLTFTVAGNVDANITYVNETAVTGDGNPGTEWGPV